MSEKVVLALIIGAMILMAIIAVVVDSDPEFYCKDFTLHRYEYFGKVTQLRPIKINNKHVYCAENTVN